MNGNQGRCTGKRVLRYCGLGPPISHSYTTPLFFKMARNLDLRCDLFPAPWVLPWVLGRKHVSNPEKELYAAPYAKYSAGGCCAMRVCARAYMRCGTYAAGALHVLCAHLLCCCWFKPQASCACVRACVDSRRKHTYTRTSDGGGRARKRTRTLCRHSFAARTARGCSCLWQRRRRCWFPCASG